jgi:dihydrofolate reductase
VPQNRPYGADSAFHDLSGNVLRLMQPREPPRADVIEDRRRGRRPQGGAALSRVVVLDHVTLDGVMQGPGRPDEDTRDGFGHGGWAAPFGDEVMASTLAARMAESGGLLFGRRTYEDLLGYWNTQESRFKDALNAAPKYVVSTTLTEPLPWPNSTLLHGDPADAVADLKREPGKDLHVMGSGDLIRTLMSRDLIDEYRLLIYPLVLGSGRRLFGDGVARTELRLVDSITTTTGVVIATYRPAAAPAR